MAARTHPIADQLHTAGLALSLSDGGLKVTPASLLTDELRATIKTHRDELIGWLQAANDPAPAKPETPEVTEAGTSVTPDLTPREADLLARRVETFIRRGQSQELAEQRAEKLLVRDRERDDRRLCLECVNYSQGLCRAAIRAGLGTGTVSVDVRAIHAKLQRCEGFEAVALR